MTMAMTLSTTRVRSRRCSSPCARGLSLVRATALWGSLAGLALLAACSDEGGALPGQLVVRLYRQPGLAVGPVTVSATDEGGTTGQVTLPTPFASCTSNRLRVLPATVTAGERLTITARATPGGEVSVSVTLPRAEVDLVFGAGAAREPSGCPPAPDGGLPVDERRVLGAACEQHAQCADGLCLKQVTRSGRTWPLNGGYCTHACARSADAGSAQACGPLAVCVEERTANDDVVGAHCFGRCEGPADCRTADGFECTLAKNCYPLPPP